jgi:hypothetical protein
MKFYFSNGDESELVSITKIVLQVICYKYKNWYKFKTTLTIYF